MTTAVPLNSLSRHVAPLEGQLTSAAKRVIHSGHYVLGPHVRKFEGEFADYCGVDHCIGVANGTDALELAMRGVGIKAGDRVAVVANAAMYSTSAVVAIGAVPVFIDVKPDSNMDAGALARAVSAEHISAVVVTHLYGRLADVEAIREATRTAGIPLVEDCAQAHGARDAQGRAAGSFGDAASFSFYPTKNLGALGDGGAVVARDPEIAETVRKLRQYGWGAKYSNELLGGRNSRLDELQAAMLSTMLPHLDSWNLRRRTIANRYSRGISNARIDVPAAAGSEYVGHLYVVQVDEREALREHLARHGVETDVHYPIPDYRQACFDGRFANVHLPHTEALASRVLSLPCFPELTDAEVEQVVDACNRF